MCESPEISVYDAHTIEHYIAAVESQGGSAEAFEWGIRFWNPAKEQCVDLVYDASFVERYKTYVMEYGGAQHCVVAEWGEEVDDGS